MKETAQIIVRSGKAEWRGGMFAIMPANELPPHKPREPFALGGLRLRVVGFVPSTSTYLDRYFVAREGPLARFVKRYNEALRDFAMYTAIKFDKVFFRLIGRPLQSGTQLPRWSLAGIAYRSTI